MATLSLPTVSPLFASVSEFFEGLANGYRLHLEYTRTLNELRSLSAREIADLGEGHLTAETLAYKAVYGDK